MITRGDARPDAAARLRAAADPSAALDADLLLAHVCGISKEALYAHLDAPLTSEQEQAYRDLVERRAAGEPVAYLRGHKEFFGLRFAVDRRVLIPRPETELLVEAVLAFIRTTGRMRVADVGTGSGAIAIAVAASEPRAHVVATDVSAGALAVARTNAAAHQVSDRVDLRQGDLLGPIGGQVDAVAANLPYLRPEAVEHLAGDRTSLAFEPPVAVVAGPDGLDVIRRCVDQLPERLAPGGAAFFECDPPQADTVQELLRGRIRGTTRVLRDLTGSPRVVEGQRG
ncbi:MAG: peptide chain release factor N(5)-glutamine methyltransferase [Chloroflexi bacterium]|nr:peptide chain release factor N(5)-glutamine methyltransferase [Chloroflexota bacterium]